MVAANGCPPCGLCDCQEPIARQASAFFSKAKLLDLYGVEHYTDQIQLLAELLLWWYHQQRWHSYGLKEAAAAIQATGCGATGRLGDRSWLVAGLKKGVCGQVHAGNFRMGRTDVILLPF